MTDITKNLQEDDELQRMEEISLSDESAKLENDTKMDTMLKYLAHIKHSVQDTGRPIFKAQDLKKVQQVLDKIKGTNFFDLDNERTTTAATQEPESPNMPMSHYHPQNSEFLGIPFRSSRNVFDYFSGKIKEMLGKRKPVDESSKFPCDGIKQKRKSDGLFNGFLAKDVHDKSVKVQEQNVQQPPVDSAISDYELIQSKIGSEQQMDVINFLDHLEDKPKPFKFDTTPFLMTQLEKIINPAVEELQNQNDAEILAPGFKKYFDFVNQPAKRSLDQAEDQRIAKLKSKLIAEYRFHHPTIDLTDIVRQVEARHLQKPVRDNFLDNYYHLNDGSSHLDFLQKSHAPDHVMSPYELNLSLKLDKDFKELDFHDAKPDNERMGSSDASPLLRP